LFLRPGFRRLTAFANIAEQFAPGATAVASPQSVQWCCATAERAG
ncbi:MAG: hypothetical protein QOG56_602, partial [Solirubrobacteraceae bacterium]|nr:hypothetical protein [Solirubrobacteraceae bacterium]